MIDRLFKVLTLLLLCANPVHAEENQLVKLSLPTDNTALLRGDGADFYQVIERNLHGAISYPWQGGQYGFVRDPRELDGETVYTRFHEGMDVRPVHRDVHGEPLDDVHAIADGHVVYSNQIPGASNYGRYVVVEHRWGDCPYYSLYAHLRTVEVAKGDKVNQGDKLGVMGHSGTGINRERSHVHVELNLLLSSNFESWHAASFPNEANHHGVYNGINLAGIDLPRLILALRKDPTLSIPAFLAREEVFYKVIVPNSPHFELPQRYPWMIAGSPNEKPSSWEVSFTRSGVPVRLTPSARAVTAAELSWLKASPVDARYLTRDVITGRGSSARLTSEGKALMSLLSFSS